MLVLSRKPAETIIINGSIRVTVVSVKGDQVRIGIETLPEVAVDREEVHRRRQQWAEGASQREFVEAWSA